MSVAPNLKLETLKFILFFLLAFDRLDLVTYEEVVYQKNTFYKSIVLIGELSVDCYRVCKIT